MGKIKGIGPLIPSLRLPGTEIWSKISTQSQGHGPADPDYIRVFR